MSTRSWHLSRRTFLRGAGAAIALPMLDAMRPLSALAASAAPKPPVRMGVLFFPNGVWQDSWIPKQVGAAYEIPFSLEPLAKLKDQFLVVTGMDKATSHGGDGHYAKTGNFLTGLRVAKTTGKDISCGSASLDQLVAQKIGHLTPLPSLELRIELAAKRKGSEAKNIGAISGWGQPGSEKIPDPRIPKDFREHVRLMLDLMVLAFQTDATRVSTFMFANDVSPRNFTGIIDGVNGGHHHLSHHQNDQDKIEQYRKINRWHVEQFAYVLGKMQAIKEGSTTLLDNSMMRIG